MTRTSSSVALGFMIGILLPCIILAIQHLAPDQMARIMKLPRAENALLALWPSSIILMGSDSSTGLLIPVISVLLNGLMYAVMFLLIYAAWKRIT